MLGIRKQYGKFDCRRILIDPRRNLVAQKSDATVGKYRLSLQNQTGAEPLIKYCSGGRRRADNRC